MERQILDKDDGGQVKAVSRPDTKQDHFRHSQLPGSRYIRLLRIIQGNTESISISITLHTFPLEQLPEYEALSYTWGKAILAGNDEDYDPEMEYEIFVNSEPVIITENLYDALSELRKDVTGYLWVDALCIDQTNMDERAAQVLLMGDIYSSAACVIIWLGKLIPEVQDVIWLRERYLPIAEEGRFPAEEVSSDLLSFLGITPTRWFELWGAYGRFYLTYRWFLRAWVVQKLIMARDVFIRCGEETIDCKILEQLTFRSTEVGSYITQESRKFFGFSNYRSLMAEDGGLEEIEIGLSLLTGPKTTEERWYSWIMHLVDIIDLQRAGCLHDKIYAVFGIALKLQSSKCIVLRGKIDWRCFGKRYSLTAVAYLVLTETQYPPAEKFSPAFGAFIVFSSALALNRANEVDRVDLLEMIRAREVDFRSSFVKLPAISTIIELAEEMKDDPPNDLLYSEYLKLINIFWRPAQQYTVGRKLFTTSQKWLGLGPECLEQGDEVWLLKHAAVLFILRPHGESQYTLVGEAYVHGIMHGELVDAPGGTEGFKEIQIV